MLHFVPALVFAHCAAPRCAQDTGRLRDGLQGVLDTIQTCSRPRRTEKAAPTTRDSLCCNLSFDPTKTISGQEAEK